MYLALVLLLVLAPYSFIGTGTVMFYCVLAPHVFEAFGASCFIDFFLPILMALGSSVLCNIIHFKYFKTIPSLLVDGGPSNLLKHGFTLFKIHKLDVKPTVAKC